MIYTIIISVLIINVIVGLFFYIIYLIWRKKKMNKEEQTVKPTPITEPFLKKQKKFLWLFPIGKEELITPEELKKDEPIMLYITEDKDIKAYKNVNPGVIKPKNKWGLEKGYENHIEARKLLSLDYAGVPIKVYLQNEKEFYSYPNEPMYDSESNTKKIRLIQANYKEYDEKFNALGKLNMKKVWVIIALIGGLVGIPIAAFFVGDVLGVWDKLGWFQPAITETAKTVIQNTTTVHP